MKGSWQNQMHAPQNQGTIDSLTLDYVNKRSPKVPRKVFFILILIIVIIIMTKIQPSIILTLLN